MAIVVHTLRCWVASIEPASLTGPQAVQLVQAFTTIERLAAAARSKVAARAAETNQWRNDGDRSPEHWLARQTGTTVGAARAALDTQRRLQSLPETRKAVEEGRLSPSEAAAVAEGASSDPAAEARLLDTARGPGSLHELRQESERVQAAARSAEDEAAREDAIRRSRSLRRRRSFDGAHELVLRGTSSQIAELEARARPFVDAEFARARKEDRREPLEAYAFDGFLAMARAASTDASGRTMSPAKVLVRVDLSAVRRGTTEPGETCEIAGFGPIPVSEALRLMSEAFLALVVTRGKQVLNVTHLGRQFTEHMKTALEWRDPECAVLGCCATVRLERDHRLDWADTRRTRVDDADRLCHFHHALKTRQGWRLEPGHGKRRLLAPAGHVAPAAADDPVVGQAAPQLAFAGVGPP